MTAADRIPVNNLSARFVPHNVARQVGIERLAMATFLARVCRDRRFRSVFVGGHAARTEHFCFVEQAELIGIPGFALCAKQLASVSAKSFLGKIALGCHEAQRVAQFVTFPLKRGVLLAHRQECLELVRGEGDVDRHVAWTGTPTSCSTHTRIMSSRMSPKCGNVCAL